MPFEIHHNCLNKVVIKPNYLYSLKKLYQLLNKGTLTESGFYDTLYINKYLKNLCKCNVGNMVETNFVMEHNIWLRCHKT